MNHINDFLLLQLDLKEKVKFSNTLMLISENFHFFTKTIFSKKLEHSVGFVLKNAINGENFVG
jgi:hypothetical protein